MPSKFTYSFRYIMTKGIVIPLKTGTVFLDLPLTRRKLHVLHISY